MFRCSHQCPEERVSGVPSHDLHPGPHQRQEADPQEGLQGGTDREVHQDPQADQQGRAEEPGQEGVHQHQARHIRGRVRV